MARVLILTDCPPDDTDWKGAFTWRIVQSLAESHHEVMVLTTLDLENIELTHSRLTVTKPVNSWRVDQLPMLVKALLTFQPEVIQTLALKPSRLWPALSLWPYLTAACMVIPGLKRVATFFDQADVHQSNSAASWLRGASRITVFSDRHKNQLHSWTTRQIEILPFDLYETREPAAHQTRGCALIPTAISEWENPDHGLKHLSEFLLRHPEASVRIVGGWGDWPISRRKQGWDTLAAVAARIKMCEPMNFSDFLKQVDEADELWLEPLRRDSWKFLLGVQLAAKWNKKLSLSSPVPFALLSGSTANSLSRLYQT